MSPTLIIILALGSVAFLGLLASIIGFFGAVAGDENLNDRLETYTITQQIEDKAGESRQRIMFLRLRMRLNNLLTTFIPHELHLQLMSANWPITETEYVLLRIGSTFFGFMLGWIISGSIFPGIGLALIAYLLPGVVLKTSINRRRLRFGNQLIDALILINGGVRAGYSLLQAIDIIIDEMQAPISEEFKRVRREVNLGLPLSQALENMSVRMENDDLNIIIAAININMQVGGNLTTMLASVTETIRERIRLFSEVRSVTASQRYTGYVLTALPFILGGVLFIMNPDYMSRLFEPGITLCIPIGALIGILVGNLVIRRMVRIDI